MKRVELQGDAKHTQWDTTSRRRAGSALRNDDWKLVREGKKWELYDMQSDRTETNDVSASKKEIFQELKEVWYNWADEMDIQLNK